MILKTIVNFNFLTTLKSIYNFKIKTKLKFVKKPIYLKQIHHYAKGYKNTPFWNKFTNLYTIYVFDTWTNLLHSFSDVRLMYYNTLNYCQLIFIIKFNLIRLIPASYIYFKNETRSMLYFLFYSLTINYTDESR